VTRSQSWGKPLNLAAAFADTARIATQMDLLEDGPAVWERLQQLGRDYMFAGKQVHDANIVATMIAHGETRLLMFNSGDFQRFAALIEVAIP
jgi:predicted nucleic acid-binding protein